MIVWPLYPDWSAPYSERYAHLTEILITDDGSEQRRALRLKARRTVEYRALATPARFGLLRQLLNRRQETIVFPDEVRRTQPSADAASGSATVSFAAIPWWMTEGCLLVFEDPDTRARTVRTVSDITGLTVTFEEPAARTWTTRTRIMPGLTGQLAASIKATMLTNDLARASITLDVEPGSEIEPSSSPVTTFGGREVLTHTPNWTGSPDIEVTDPTEWVDPQFGVRAPYRPVTFMTEIRSDEHLLRSAEDVDAVLGLFLRARGRQGEFHQPSGLNDFVLMEATASGASTWRVAGHDFAAAYDNDPVHQSFCILLRSGAVHRFRISDITTGGGGTPYSQIATTTAAPLTINPADVLMISWMPCVRFASDEIELTWKTDSIAEVLLNTMTLKDIAA